jgi:hypothetical protein
VLAIFIIKLLYLIQQMAAKIQKKSLDSSPDETRTFEKGKIELANLEAEARRYENSLSDGGSDIF